MIKQPDTVQSQDLNDNVIESASATTSNAKKPAGPTVYFIFIALVIALFFGASHVAEKLAFDFQYFVSHHLSEEDIANLNRKLKRHRYTNTDNYNSYLDRETIDKYLDDSDVSTTSYRLT